MNIYKQGKKKAYLRKEMIIAVCQHRDMCRKRCLDFSSTSLNSTNGILASL